MVRTTAQRRVAIARRTIDETPETAVPFRSEIQHAFGRHSIAHLRAHAGNTAQAQTKALDGDAFAYGDRLVFGSRPSLHLAAHEAAHGYLQSRGVAPASAGAPGDPHERVADAVADRVAAGRSAEAILDRAGSGPASQPSLQMGKDQKQQQRRKAKKKGGVGKRKRKRAAYGGDDPAKPIRVRGSALQRLQRANQRGLRRQAAGDAGSRHAGVGAMFQALRNWEGSGTTQAQVASGAGPFQLSTGRAAQPKVTMRQPDYGGATFGPSAPPYAPAVTAVSGVPNGPALLQQAFETGNAPVAGLTGRQQLATAALSSIPHTAEENRVPGMAKAFRALVRQGVAEPAKFNMIPQAFPMVASAQHGRDVLAGTSPMHADLTSALEDDDYYSASSGEEDNDSSVADDDESDDAAREALKRKQRRPRDDDDDDEEGGGGGSGGGHRYQLRSRGAITA